MIRSVVAQIGIAFGLACLWPQPAFSEGVDTRICFGYACAHDVQVHFDAATLDPVARMLEDARDAEEERILIARAVAQLYVAAGRQAPIWRDRGGNRNDDTDLPGAMDCIDHSTNTTGFLRIMAHAGMIRFHRVGEPVRRVQFFVAEHWSARLIESASSHEYVVDSWFFDPGTPAVVMPVQAWRAGEAPAQSTVIRR